MAAQTEVVNCVDVSNPDIHQSAAILKQALETSGFFYVINHGISEELINEVFAQAKKFFSLPYDEKTKLTFKGNQRFTEKSMFVDEKTGIRARGETLITIHESDRDTGPSSDILSEWNETLLRYNQETLNLKKVITRIMATALGLNIDFIDQWELFGNAQSIVAFSYYPGDNSSKEHVYGAPPHNDPFIITLLATDDVPGLQICTNLDAKPQLWKTVLPLKGAFIAFPGDMLEIMSNCVFRSTNHRVLYNQDRYSIASFMYPIRDDIIECLPSCRSPENPPKLPPIKCGEILNARYGIGYDE